MTGLKKYLGKRMMVAIIAVLALMLVVPFPAVTMTAHADEKELDEWEEILLWYTECQVKNATHNGVLDKTEFEKYMYREITWSEMTILSFKEHKWFIEKEFLDKGYFTDRVDEFKSLGVISADYQLPAKYAKQAAKSQAAAASLDYSKVFDAKFYASKYPSLAKAGVTTDQQLLDNFKSAGMKNMLQGNAEFNPVVYIQNNPDLVALYGTDYAKYYEHYMTTGYKENRIHK